VAYVALFVLTLPVTGVAYGAGSLINTLYFYHLNAVDSQWQLEWKMRWHYHTGRQIARLWAERATAQLDAIHSPGVEEELKHIQSASTALAERLESSRHAPHASEALFFCHDHLYRIGAIALTLRNSRLLTEGKLKGRYVQIVHLISNPRRHIEGDEMSGQDTERLLLARLINACRGDKVQGLYAEVRLSQQTKYEQWGFVAQPSQAHEHVVMLLTNGAS
jgi:hypothetical protein